MTGALLAVEDVTVSFAGLVALNSVSMEISKGEIVSLIGPNGAGKTTLFNVVCGFVKPLSGSVVHKGKELVHIHPKDLPGLGIARTLQGVSLFHGMTVFQNVMTGAQARLRADLASAILALPRSAREESALRSKVGAALDELGIGRFANAYPGALPYGVQKKVAIARALISEPDLLMLDEPASGLSAAEMDELGQLLDHWREKLSVLVVEHHMEFVMAISDKVVVLNSGEVIAVGTPDQVSADPQVTDAYLGDEVDGEDVS